ncbi:MAG TPA: TfoX/Sxy family protein [Flavipsychrobacter sp.]|nr:TfoX/Sxy family protein [Flavipsychrobacter sp.]
MAYNEKMVERIRELLVLQKKVEEKKMFGGVCFMVNDKMCVGVNENEIMCRIDPLIYEEALEKKGAREMTFTGKPMKGYVFVDDEGIKTKKDLEKWVDLCLDFNSKAKSSKKKK